MILILLWLLGPAALTYGLTGDWQDTAMALGCIALVLALLATFAPEK